MDVHPIVTGQSDENILIRRYKNVLKSTGALLSAMVQGSSVLYSYESTRFKGLWRQQDWGGGASAALGGPNSGWGARQPKVYKSTPLPPNARPPPLPRLLVRAERHQFSLPTKSLTQARMSGCSVALLPSRLPEHQAGLDATRGRALIGRSGHMIGAWALV